MFSPSTAGAGTFQITYTYTDGNGCQGSASDTINVSICNAVTGGFQVAVKVYPNPSDGNFHLFVGEHADAVHFQVFNLMGQVLRAGEVESGNTVLDLGEQPAGLYILSVETGGMHKNFNLEIRR